MIRKLRNNGWTWWTEKKYPFPDCLERSPYFHRFYVVSNSMHIDLEVWFLTAKKVFLSNFEASHTTANKHLLLHINDEMCSFAKVWIVLKLNI